MLGITTASPPHASYTTSVAGWIGRTSGLGRLAVSGHCLQVEAPTLRLFPGHNGAPRDGDLASQPPVTSNGVATIVGSHRATVLEPRSSLQRRALQTSERTSGYRWDDLRA